MADQSKIDAYLGSGTWANWQTLLRGQTDADKGSEDWDRWFTVGATGDLVWRCRDDIVLLDMVAEDYQNALDQVSAGSRLSKTQLRCLAQAYQKAIDLLAGDNQIIQAIQQAGIPRALTALGLEKLKEQADDAKAAVQEALRTIALATTRKNQAETVAYFDAASILLKAALPELTIAGKIAFGLGKWAVGKYVLDVKKPEEIEDSGKAVDTLLSFKKLRKFKAGLAHPALLLALDAEKIGEEELLITNARLAIKQAEEKIDKLADMIQDRKNLLAGFKGSVKELELKCWTTRAKLLNNVEIALCAAGYNLETMYLGWRYEAR